MRNIAIYLADIKGFHGIGEVERCIASGIAKRATELKEKHSITFTFIVPKTEVGKYGNDIEYMEIKNKTVKLINSDFSGIIRKLFLPHFDLIHLTHQYSKFHRSIASNTLVTIHDINFVHNGNSSSRAMRRRAHRIKRIEKIATHMSFISDFTYRDVMEHFPFCKPYKIIKNGSQDWTTLKRQEIEGLPQDFLFHISDAGEKKNVHLLVEMMRYLPQENLVIAGATDPINRKRITDIIDNYALKNVTLLGRVSDEEKAFLLDRCKCFLFPSRSEGFGLPVIEAMCFGKPVVISKLTSLPEIGGDIAYYFDELEPEAMATKTITSCKDFYSNEQQNAEATINHARSFSWEKAVDEYIQYYMEIMKLV